MPKENQREIKITSTAFFNILGEIEYNARISQNYLLKGRLDLAAKYQGKIFKIIEELRQDFLRAEQNLKKVGQKSFFQKAS